MKDNSGWLASLKEGDEVCYHSRWRGYQIVKITKITPTRQVKTNDSRTWRNGSSGSGWDSLTIEPVTEKIRRSIWRGTTLSRLSNTNFSALSDDQLRIVLSMFEIEEVSE